jgi:hypothetical protein
MLIKRQENLEALPEYLLESSIQICVIYKQKTDNKFNQIIPVQNDHEEDVDFDVVQYGILLLGLLNCCVEQWLFVQKTD